MKIHKSYRDVVAICDSDLLGKFFEEGEKQLDVKESFFGGEEVDEETLKGLIEKMSGDDATFNIIGEESVKCAVDCGVIKKEGVGKIGGVEFALVLM